MDPTEITELRQRLGLGRTEFANLLGLGNQGERTVRGWETGEHRPSNAKIAAIRNLENELIQFHQNAPFANDNNGPAFRFIDLFAGIGGIRLPFQRLGGECVFSAEWDKFAQKTYLANFGEMPAGDITQIAAADIPEHDVLLAGFPCQAFSQAGLRKGFNDTRGTMFFEIQRILAETRPAAFLLENVKQLRGHDKGRTLKTILAILRGEYEQEVPEEITLGPETRRALERELNYWVDFKVLRAADFGAPQNRERVFIVGFDKDQIAEQDIERLFQWPVPPQLPTRVGDILEELTASERQKYTISDRLWAGHQRRRDEHRNRGNGFGYSLFSADSEYTNTISARYYKDGSEILIDQSEFGLNPRKLTPRECARLQGFPENYIVDAVSTGQIYKQFGNSVCMSVVAAVADSMYEVLQALPVERREAI